MVSLPGQLPTAPPPGDLGASRPIRFVTLVTVAVLPKPDKPIQEITEPSSAAGALDAEQFGGAPHRSRAGAAAPADGSTSECWRPRDRRPVDGEVHGMTPVRISLLPQTLRVLVPSTFVDT
jgi:hypothetical protein